MRAKTRVDSIDEKQKTDKGGDIEDIFRVSGKRVVINKRMLSLSP